MESCQRNIGAGLVILTCIVAGCGKSGASPENEPAVPKAENEFENRKSRMRRIGIAMHDYAVANEGRYPAYDANGYSKDWKKKRKQGLSWRVYILPFLGEQKLYDQFHHKEPWDSPNNKKLIAQMPAVFRSHGVTEPGKTSMHVFIDPGNKDRRPRVPFGINFSYSDSIGPKIRDITDGTPNTLMFVEAGPDKAEVWTKPSGLPFDPDSHPLDALGSIEQSGFLVVFFDGYVGRIEKSISKKQMIAILGHHNRRIGDKASEEIGKIPGIDRAN